MALPGILSDLPLIGADVFNARAQAEEESRLIQQEEQEREAKRRREALSMAVSQLQKEDLETQRDRHREELRRIREGLTPTPTEESTAPSIGLGVRGDNFEEYKRRYGEITDLEAQRASEVEAARQAARDRYRVERPDAPPSLNEIQDASNEVVSSIFAAQPLADLGEILSLVQSDHFISTLPPPLRLLVEGGQINQSTLSAAYERKRGNVDLRDAQTQAIIQTIDEACRAGMDPEIIRSDVGQNPDARTSQGTLKEFYDDYIYNKCG